MQDELIKPSINYQSINEAFNCFKNFFKNTSNILENPSFLETWQFDMSDFNISKAIINLLKMVQNISHE